MRHLFALTASLLMAGIAAAGTPLPADHPLLGTWVLNVPSRHCAETYQMRGDGTTLVTSAEEISQSEFWISDKPSARGFYTWSNKTVKNNGGKDCSGNVGKPGKTVSFFLRFHPSGNLFVLCRKEDLNTCLGPFVRQQEESI